mgnify:CR=1 FL=1
MDRYITDSDGQPLLCPDLMTWAAWMESGERRVALDVFGDVRVSTVFLGIDHRFDAGDPVLWETMVFGGPLDGEQERYTSRAAALDGHQAMADRVRVMEAA